MSRRADHIAEFRFALENNCSLPEARRRMAWLKNRARIEALKSKDKPSGGEFLGAKPPASQPKFWWEDRDQ